MVKISISIQCLYCKRHMSKGSYNDTQYRRKCRQKWTVSSYKSFLSQYAHSFMALDPTSNIWSMFVLLLFCFSFFWLMILNNVCYIYWIFNWMFKRMLLWGTHLKYLQLLFPVAYSITWVFLAVLFITFIYQVFFIPFIDSL